MASRRRSVLPLLANRSETDGLFNPYLHFAIWHTIRTGGRVPGLFNAVGQSDATRPEPNFTHFVLRSRLYDPTDVWINHGYAPLDWSRITREYQFIIVAGSDSAPRAMIAHNTCELARTRDIGLYKVLTRTDASAGSNTGCLTAIWPITR